ncbi:high mobility group B protein 9 [Tripterygium wilfordii]|uniref:high mobility group B protein 9 n=1 Tax=Tripterygium wilfordii TaxID=458696 RepID=UPI0018F7F0DF|nr:high mobility group B protein 9 [Tripterygium wilfordii]
MPGRSFSTNRGKAQQAFAMSPAGRNNAIDVLQTKLYPAPLATQEDVVKDHALFLDTLRRFHCLMTTKFMIPVIGGKELDLHVLYVEVTKRGGYEKVVADKKWREVGAVFRFSPTTTSASFVLKKHYFSLLYFYEQVHFFRMQGPLQAPAVASPVNNSSCRPEWAIVEYAPKKIRDGPHPPVEGIGTIDGKFDCGYLVSVKLGSEVLKGVLYHIEEPSSSATISETCTAIVPYTGKRGRRSLRRRRTRRLEDPSYPKPNRSGYNFFFAEKHYKLKSLYPNREREFTKMIGASWSSLSAEERVVYQNIGLKDKERYRRELKEYKERLKAAERPWNIAELKK